MPDPSPTDHHARPPFPPWLRELCYFGGIIVTLTVFALTGRSDQRSMREELARVSKDVSDTRNAITSLQASLPNKETLDVRLKSIDDRVDKLARDLEFEAAKHQKFKEDLLSKGVLK